MIIPLFVIIGVAATLFATAPKAEDFWWTDAASFALNGEFVRDYLARGLHQSPMAFANDWFAHYPALTISLYPPIFPLAEALGFSLFGFSHVVAQATVGVFTVIAGYGAYRMCRTAVGPLDATGGVLLMFAAPGILLWSRQVMMEVPALAFMLLASAWLLEYQNRRRPRDLILAVLGAVAAVYTKQPAIFIAGAFVLALIADRGLSVLRDRWLWFAAVLAFVLLLPLAVFTVWTAGETIDIALGRGIAAQSGGAMQGGGHFAQAIAFASALPEIVGWPLLAGALGSIGLMAVRGWRDVAERRLVVLMAGWFGFCLLFVSSTGHFEARYGMALAVPCAVTALLLVRRLRFPWTGLAVGAALFLAAVMTHGVSRMTGYDQVAAYVLDHSKQDDVVWFQARESKNFVFSVRSHDPAEKLSIRRGEKFLVDYHIERDWGAKDRSLTTADIDAIFQREHVSIVVLQPDFWTDLPSMRLMQDYIRSDRFRQVATFQITADEPSQRTAIQVFVKR